jgi:hypothetical protein
MILFSVISSVQWKWVIVAYNDTIDRTNTRNIIFHYKIYLLKEDPRAMCWIKEATSNQIMRFSSYAFGFRNI